MGRIQIKISASRRHGGTRSITLSRLPTTVISATCSTTFRRHSGLFTMGIPCAMVLTQLEVSGRSAFRESRTGALGNQTILGRGEHRRAFGSPRLVRAYYDTACVRRVSATILTAVLARLAKLKSLRVMRSLAHLRVESSGGARAKCEKIRTLTRATCAVGSVYKFASTWDRRAYSPSRVPSSHRQRFGSRCRWVGERGGVAGLDPTHAVTEFRRNIQRSIPYSPLHQQPHFLARETVVPDGRQHGMVQMG